MDEQDWAYLKRKKMGIPTPTVPARAPGYLRESIAMDMENGPEGAMVIAERARLAGLLAALEETDRHVA